MKLKSSFWFSNHAVIQVMRWPGEKCGLGVCAVEIPVAKKWYGEDSFLFF